MTTPEQLGVWPFVWRKELNYRERSTLMLCMQVCMQSLRVERWAAWRYNFRRYFTLLGEFTRVYYPPDTPDLAHIIIKAIPAALLADAVFVVDIAVSSHPLRWNSLCLCRRRRRRISPWRLRWLISSFIFDFHPPTSPAASCTENLLVVENFLIVWKTEANPLHPTSKIVLGSSSG